MLTTVETAVRHDEGTVTAVRHTVGDSRKTIQRAGERKSELSQPFGDRLAGGPPLIIRFSRNFVFIKNLMGVDGKVLFAAEALCQLSRKDTQVIHVFLIHIQTDGNLNAGIKKLEAL